ncbi:hypothetical protein NDA16_003850 [Ustilago loliicola]|nr:hypothetical protein NDA16_003850 [Ustilago loliicola]
MVLNSLTDDGKGFNDVSPRLRSNAFASDLKDDSFFFKDQHQHHQSSLPTFNRSIGSAHVTDDSEMGMGRVGWKVVGGLVVFGLFLLLSNGANSSDYKSAPSFLSLSSLVYKTAKTSMQEVFAKCSQKNIHPIACKVEHAAELASQISSRQSTTPEQAVHAYKRRYLRSPPAAFEQWVRLALEHNATVIDDYDQIEVDINTFRQAGLVGNKLKKRILEAKATLPGYEFGQLSIVDRQAVVFGPDLGPLSASALIELLQPVQHIIPDVTIPFNWYAEPRMPHPAPSSSSTPVKSIDAGKKDPTDILQQACPSNHISPMRSWNGLEPPLDYCQEEVDEIKDLHGFLQSAESFWPFNKLVPMLSRSKMSNFADILAPNVCYASRTYRGLPDTIPWDKKLDSVYWRGTTTGEHQTATTWARGHRHRMMRHIKQLREAANKLATGVEKDPFDEIYGSNRTITPSRDSIDVAGNTLPLFDYTDRSSMSCRFYQLLTSNSVVFKQTIWSEYHDDRLVPWIHYVPLDLRVQNNELPMLLDFFINDAQGRAAAAKIAAASRDWAEKSLRPIDVSLYYARLLIEFAELYHQDS